ncbi:hypothetical protein [Allocoleopsis sp.]
MERNAAALLHEFVADSMVLRNLNYSARGSATAKREERSADRKKAALLG